MVHIIIVKHKNLNHEAPHQMKLGLANFQNLTKSYTGCCTCLQLNEIYRSGCTKQLQEACAETVMCDIQFSGPQHSGFLAVVTVVKGLRLDFFCIPVSSNPKTTRVTAIRIFITPRKWLK